MGSTALNNINQLTPDNLAIRDLRELLFLEVLQAGAINEIVDLNYGVLNGAHLGGVGEFGLLGEDKAMCRPTFNNTNLATQQKIWELGRIVVAEEMCADDFESTVAKFSMKTGTDRADLTQTDLLSYIIEPRLKTAIEKMIWRVSWFGDKAAQNVYDGGIIKDGIDVKFFTMADGLFKKLFAITAANTKQRVTIAANTAATYTAQRDNMRASGAATGVIDALVYNANPILRQAEGRFILCTQSFADALAIDIKANNKGSDLQWQSLFGGLAYATEYNGEKLIRLPIWDEMIQAFEDNGTTLNKPHRALFCTKDNLKVGFESSNLMPDLKIWFSEDDQTNKILGRDKMGTLTWQDELIQFAY
ncbi:hypothetical protein [Dysgonomonas mossii]|uniref:Major capsid protein n=1 Tax=Dysgonomonas mossii DSM 22836 TaxID=742767 RepID=F8X556_9BACT|nr:hypothetical protein [Dysgonomonas mossii]EGK04662.1 hypothetical protein HMPREF9456_03365 [Dysgonomonas mossii DSM 22836]